MAELVWGQPLGLWLYLATAGVLFVGWWSIADSRHLGGGEIAAFAFVVSLFWGITLPIALIVVAGMYGCDWLESTSGWLSRRVEKWFGNRKRKK